MITITAKSTYFPLMTKKGNIFQLLSVCSVLCSFWKVLCYFLSGNPLIQFISGNTDKQLKLSLGQNGINYVCPILYLISSL